MYVALSLLLFANTISAQTGQHGDICGKMKIQCACGIDEDRQDLFLELPRSLIQDTKTGGMKCVDTQDPYQACANHTCIFIPNESEDKNVALGSFLASFYPQTFTIPSGGFAKKHRFTRQTDPCHTEALDHAEVKCWKWPDFIVCAINCTYGHAFQRSEDTVTNVHIKCRSTENVWKPYQYADCEPYVNCNPHLVNPGNLNCKQPREGPSYCDISCFDYDELEAVPQQRYDCIDENFAGTLPHCAVLNDDELVMKPN